MSKFNMADLLFGGIDIPEVSGENLAGLNLLGAELEMDESEAREESSSEGNKEDRKDEEKDAKLSEEDSDSNLADSVSESRGKSVSTPKEDENMGDTPSVADPATLSEQVRMEEMRPGIPKREYKFLTVGKESNGEDIYRFSEFHVPEDVELKQRIISHNMRHLMGIKVKGTSVRDSKVRRRQKAKEIHQKLNNHYRSHKPKIFDEIELWLPTTEHFYKRRVPENPYIVNLKEESQTEMRNRTTSQSFDPAAYKGETGKAETQSDAEVIHIQNWVSEVVDTIKRSGERFHNKKLKEEENKAKRDYKDFLADIYSQQDPRFDDNKLYFAGERAGSTGDPKQNIAILMESTEPDNHWGSIKNSESSFSSYKKIKKLQEHLEPVFEIKRETELEDKAELPVEMLNVREIKRFQPINKELNSANWTNAVLIKGFKNSEDRCKALYNRYMNELPHTFQPHLVHGVEENFDLIYLRSQQRAERKDSFVRNISMNPQGGYMRLRSQSFGLQNDAQADQKEGHGEITSLHMRVTKSKILKIMHAKIVHGMKYNKLRWESYDLENFHRPKLTESTALSFTRKGKEWHRHRLDSDVWNVRVFKEKRKAEEASGNSKINKELINAHEFFKNRIKLSLKADKFCIMEHIDENPLFINNFGMASKIIKYIHVTPEHVFKGKTSHMGPYGIEMKLSLKDRIPLLGQLDPSHYKGITILENNMYRAPVFYHDWREQDFLLIKHKSKNGVSFYAES
eukprot:TRINITY_DN1733_c0_g4_i1.p1 TRINITY_DN1733_c0_g4~~TRINITY_DN1733_c0_g4_i1.p1  ORF type:complete len:740 (+),score=207.69 TRINITY_DN1733_c0_g4_i1:252-2471(+)